MELSAIRDAVLSQVDFQPTRTTEFLAILDGFINRALRNISLEAPFLLQRNVTLYTQPDVVSVSSVTSDRLAVDATDEYVLGRTVTTGDAAWVFTGGWNSRWIELNDDGVLRRVQTREFWQVGNQHYVSLVRPWRGGSGPMTYRIYTPEYPLEGDVTSVLGAKLYNYPNTPIVAVTRETMERSGLLDSQGTYTGRPDRLYLGTPFQLPTPTKAPVATVGNPTWAGPDNAGSFAYCYTVAWGYRDVAELSRMGLTEPIWESAPSPLSNTVTTTNSGSVINVGEMPNIDAQYNFGRTGTTRLNRSGFYKRIWAKRISADTSAPFTTYVESPNVLMLLAQTTAAASGYEHSGSVYLDYDRRLRPIHGYQTLRFYPAPDARYEVDVRVQVRPMKLENPQDTPAIPEDAMDVLIEKTLEHYYEHEKQADMAERARTRYKDMLKTLRKRYASVDYGPMKKNLARVGVPGYGGSSRRVNYTGVE